MSLSPNILAAFDQVGLLGELEAVSIPAGETNILYDDMKVIASFPNSNTNNEYVNPTFPVYQQKELGRKVKKGIPMLCLNC